MGKFKTRFYDVIMTATDAAAHTVSDTCKVIIVPLCDSANPKDCEMVGGVSYLNRTVVEKNVLLSERSYVIDEEELLWQSGLDRPDPNEKADKDVDVDNNPPEVSCSLETQGLLGNGAGVFKDLSFDFTAVGGGNKCTDTEDLKVAIEVLSNEVVVTGE